MNRYLSSIRLLLGGSALVVLGACSLAPGQRIITPATLPETGGKYSTEPQQQVNVPITDINLAMLRQMNSASQSQAESNAATLNLFGKPTPYQIGPGDVLQITVWDHPELAAAVGQPTQAQRPADAAPGFLVDDSGNVQFPYAGTLHVAGKNTATVQNELHSRLSEVFLKPEVTVRVASFRAAQVYIDGEVHTPGAQAINDIPMSMTEAINRAGGFTQNADQSRVTLVRNGVSYPVNVADLIEHGRSPSNIYLKNGDMLRIASRDDNGVFLMGEVNRPATIMPMRDGRLTLSQAVSQAGSLNPNTAEASQLFVIRNSMSDKPEIFHLDATSPVSMLLANQFELQPNDVVYVDNNGLVRFNRVLNLLLPAINAGVTSAVLAK
ncbi:polysaccharide biosynthesis/export family protein [Paraburkholderia caballeronis]|uniref:Polysaccharide export outer membrane protein n=1 Tax=Paraburkholderia caballeronis TaxID=416943 RepID=A0A1H7I8T1_9BURK|nr:polysaccharide biosynthesis/export family protein [Paraburkholderia caballeronis]PXW29166.1 polysaccharide export outer membrane protein [Paraburkholderia caballeronis]PXX04425.1 polysaccharide export outer membrane protein [Paraburkholderia caballeronis]RAK05486.1 polysaccharide export outer membrane protein [Paraburkholderia caballeronis]TDV18262.1 polysaccharide export outer membrane protein [Paraburkholderia caballeronis]TDV20200.1 polysaccharide export outer membrane protein [Paraburkh